MTPAKSSVIPSAVERGLSAHTSTSASTAVMTVANASMRHRRDRTSILRPVLVSGLWRSGSRRDWKVKMRPATYTTSSNDRNVRR